MSVDRIIWLALFASTFVYGLIAYVIVAPRATGTFDQSLRSQFIQRNRPPRVRMIVSMAAYESCAIFGLVAAMLAGDWRLYLAPWVLCLIGFARMFPTSEPTLA